MFGENCPCRTVTTTANLKPQETISPIEIQIPAMIKADSDILGFDWEMKEKNTLEFLQLFTTHQKPVLSCEWIPLSHAVRDKS